MKSEFRKYNSEMDPSGKECARLLACKAYYCKFPVFEVITSRIRRFP